MSLRLVLGHAVRYGYAPANVADALTRRETPKAGPSRLRFLDEREVTALLKHTPKRYRLALTMAVFCGSRLGELLAIRWRDVNLTDGYIAITGQIGDKGERLPYPKTAAGFREVVAMNALTKMLTADKLASRFSGPYDYVIASEVGTAMSGRNLAQRRLEKATTDALLEDVTFHTTRHTFASILIAQGHDPVYVANQLGHASPSVTLDVYSHLFARARHAKTHRDRLDSDFGGMVGGIEV